MKKLVLVALMALATALTAAAQDIVTKKDGTDIRAKILEVGLDDIKYKASDNLGGPTYTLPLSDILMIQYGNGRREIIKQDAAPVQQASAQPAVSTDPQPAADPPVKLYASDPSKIQPGMKYWDYHKLYNKDDYSDEVHNRNHCERPCPYTARINPDF